MWGGEGGELRVSGEEGEGGELRVLGVGRG